MNYQGRLGKGYELFPTIRQKRKKKERKKKRKEKKRKGYNVP